MTFGDREHNTVSISPNREGYEIRLYNTRGEYWTATLTTAEVFRVLALVEDVERARKLAQEAFTCPST